MTQRLLILLAVLCVGFGATFALPKPKAIRPTAMPGEKMPRQEFGDMTLPVVVGNFYAGVSLPAGFKEKEVLSADTGFSKRQYVRRNLDFSPKTSQAKGREEGDQEVVTASVVTAGSDMGNSIHRPERCLTAQGHNLAPSKKLLFKCKNNVLPVTKIQASKTEILITQNPDGTPGKEVPVERDTVMYYWFVGADSVTNSHVKRAAADLWDRVTTGTDQEWAYASITLPINAMVDQLATRDDSPGERIFLRNLDDKALDDNGFTEADRVARDFIEDFASQVMDERQIKNWDR